MWRNILLIAHLSPDAMMILASIVAGLLGLMVLFGLFLAPILIWRSRVRRRGYPGLRAYLRDLPQTDDERLDAVDLALKGMVLCVLGVLFPPLIVIGLVPLYYGLRKLAAVRLGIKARTADELGE
jgi:hypothetical protein